MSIGGDIFPGRRHFLPVLWCLAMLVAVTWRARWDGCRWRRSSPCSCWRVSVHGYQQRSDRGTRRARQLWEWDCGLVCRHLGNEFGELQPLVAADPLGCVGYFSKLPMLDMLGLTDRYLAHQSAGGFRHADSFGHELGNGRYVLSRSPAIVLTCVPGAPPGPCYPQRDRDVRDAGIPSALRARRHSYPGAVVSDRISGST